MRYLRMLTNSVIAGLLGATYVAIVVLQLNPAFPIRDALAGPLLPALGLFYGANLAAFFYALIVVRQVFAEEVLSPGWISVRILAWLSAGTATAATVLMWLNLSGFRAALDAAAARRMAFGIVAMAVSAAALLTIAVLHYSLGRRGSRVSASLLAGAIAASVVVPLARRGPAVPPAIAAERLSLGDFPPVASSPRVVMVLLDGASLDFISPAVAEGRLPNFGKILDLGAALHLATVRPTQPAPVWAAVATGRYPSGSGVRSAATYRFDDESAPLELLPDLCFAHGLVQLGFLSEIPNGSEALHAAPIWAILSRLGLTVTVVGWPATYPAEPVRGAIVTDRFHLAPRAALPVHDDHVVSPREALAVVRSAAAPDEVSGVVVAGSGAPGDASLPDVPTERDEVYRRALTALAAQSAAHFAAVRYDGVDLVGHRFLRYAMPRAFGDVSDEEVRQYGDVLGRYYAFIDAEIGAAIAGLGPGDLLLVVSGFGMQPVSLGKRLLARLMGDPDLSGSHEAAPDGFMLAYGDPVAAGRLPLGSIVDVAPTVLYFFGLPVARDMDGYARTDLFTREFTAERPITFIPSYQR